MVGGALNHLPLLFCKSIIIVGSIINERCINTKRSIINERSIITKRSCYTEMRYYIGKKYYYANKYYRTRKCTVNQSSDMTAHIVLYKGSVIFQFRIIIQISIMRTKIVL